jgi:cytochrome c oxidase subunit 3
MDTYTIPLTNTVLLLSSGATVTWAHHAIVLNAKRQTIISLIFTLILAFFLHTFKGLEYVTAPFNISDSVYGSCFYMATGFHGFHVFVGTIALIVSFVRIVLNHGLQTLIILVLNQLFGIGTLLMLFGYFYLSMFIGGEILSPT